MSYGLPVKSNAARLRAEICQFIQNNPHLKISDTPLQDWVKWDANSTVGEYARKMSRGSWGGGIEMACLSLVRTKIDSFCVFCKVKCELCFLFNGDVPSNLPAKCNVHIYLYFISAKGMQRARVREECVGLQAHFRL